MESLADELMALMARALDLDEDWFGDKIDQHISNLIVNHYPAQPTPPFEDQIRRGAYTDYVSLSILYQTVLAGAMIVTTLLASAIGRRETLEGIRRAGVAFVRPGVASGLAPSTPIRGTEPE